MIKVENFPNAYKEGYEILKYIDEKELKLIPEAFINMINHNMNNDYEFEFDENIDFQEQKILKETKTILAYIFLNYWATEKQSNAIKQKFKQDIMEEEIKKAEKYSSNIFQEKNQTISDLPVISSG